MIQLATALAKRLFGKLPLPDGAKDKIANVNAILAGGSGEKWVPLARQQATLPIRNQFRGGSISTERGERDHDGEPVRWAQFDWSEQRVDDCTFHKVRWRFHSNGLICLELVASKDATGLDVRDLVGHRIELRDRSGFLIGIWLAAFIIDRGTEHAIFQATAVDDFLPLKLHFDEVADVQEGLCFRI
ncbi:hypothetical protein [Mesorhizobium sp. ZC-5]|uniref:hypothetical protein n=1 Tax=Mesorhizobium sp. ZC-5 TaxID=2986066 RepID=UPI0021E7EB20|nr:hypothetical protein [Mesorhizobium sp. ZC-5]MCV3241718.1 hypothetical protein [Mesorhizobium sp. ZC-5]